MLNALRTDNSPFTEPQLEQLKLSIGMLDAAQAQWLSGYLAGQLSLSPQLQAQAANSATQQAVLSVFYGSETGNGEAVARQLAEQLKTAGIAAELVSLEGYRPSALRKLEYAAFVISTHGEGDPPETALDLFEFLESDRAPQLPQLHYQVLALGDLSYTEFCAAGRRLDERLAALGATRLADRVDCDLDYQAQASDWRAQVLEYARTELQTDAPTTDNRTVPVAPALSVVPSTPRWTRSHPYLATLERQQKITGQGSSKDIWHLELSLGDSGLTYQAGDSLGVWAPNDADLVDAVLQQLGLAADAPVQVDDKAVNLAEALREQRELTRLSRATVLGYAELINQPALAQHYEALDTSGQKQFVEQRQFADLVAAWPGRPEAQALVDLLRPLAPRSYSIASSQALADDEVHLTVASLFSQAPDSVPGETRRGVASDYLNRRLQEGTQLRVFPEPNPRFRLPQDATAPIIMIAAGTGIAPYRAFMQQREALGHQAPAWLIFGNPNLRSDFLYQREWLQWRERGLLTRIDTAFSRDQSEKRYVQHVIAEQAGRIQRWLQRGAYVYLCGGLDMGQSVQQALQQVLVTERGLDAEQAALEWSVLRREKRLQKDLY